MDRHLWRFREEIVVLCLVSCTFAVSRGESVHAGQSLEPGKPLEDREVSGLL